VDILDSSGFWRTGDTGVIPPPPPPPVPVETGDGIILFSSAGQYVRTHPVREPTNPWVELIAWWRRLRRIDAEWISPEMLQMIERDDQEIIELTRLTRRK